jgi:hypothetical protein
MATEQHFSIRKGRTCSLTIDITGVTIWTDIVAKLFADYDLDTSAPEIILTGTIDTGNSQATFTFDKDTTKNIEAQRSLRYEASLYKVDGSYIKDVSYGLLNIAPTVKEHPNL